MRWFTGGSFLAEVCKHVAPGQQPGRWECAGMQDLPALTALMHGATWGPLQGDGFAFPEGKGLGCVSASML